MDSRNQYVRYIYYEYCGWGKRTVVTHEVPYKGGVVPLWNNCGKKP